MKRDKTTLIWVAPVGRRRTSAGSPFLSTSSNARAAHESQSGITLCAGISEKGPGILRENPRLPSPRWRWESALRVGQAVASVQRKHDQISPRQQVGAGLSAQDLAYVHSRGTRTTNHEIVLLGTAPAASDLYQLTLMVGCRHHLKSYEEKDCHELARANAWRYAANGL